MSTLATDATAFAVTVPVAHFPISRLANSTFAFGDSGWGFSVDNLLLRIHFIIEMSWWTGLVPWEFEFPFPGSLLSPLLPSRSPKPNSRSANWQTAPSRLEITVGDWGFVIWRLWVMIQGCGPGFRVWGSGLMIWGLRFGVTCCGFEVKG